MVELLLCFVKFFRLFVDLYTDCFFCAKTPQLLRAIIFLSAPTGAFLRRDCGVRFDQSRPMKPS